jgi:4-hydroxyacetophenone monooxygenase
VGAIDTTVTDQDIRDALEVAHVPSLLLALVHLTGDLSLIRGDIRPAPEFLSDAQDGVPAEAQARARQLAYDVLVAARDGAGDHPAELDDAALVEMMGYLTGQEVAPEYLEFLTAELALRGEDAYAQPTLEAVPPEARQQLKVIVIGAGMSGILTAIRLQEAGIAFEIIEKNADVGGTWHENTYPGCRVDSGNHVYSYSFRPRDWPQYFSSQPVLRDYFAETADAYGLREHIRFRTEVLSATLDEAQGLWRLLAREADGAEVELVAHAVVSAVGQLNRPRLPDLPGVGSFAGPCFHSARWRHDVDLSGKRVGVIGTGGSAFQFVPHVAEVAEQVTVFQRTAPWNRLV